MKNWLFDRLLGFAGSKLSGYKTKIAAVAFLLYALVGVVGKLFPDAGLPEMEWQQIADYITAGLAVFGIGHKIEKYTQTLQITSTSQQNPNVQEPIAVVQNSTVGGKEEMTPGSPGTGTPFGTN